MQKLNINIEDLFNMPGAVIYNPDGFKPVNSVVIDSRKVKSGSLFVAIKGENFDAHDFIPQVIENGAAAVIVDKKKLKSLPELEITVVTVPDTVKAFGYLANCWRKKLDAKIVSLTGSSGKTTTKEMIATLLSEKYKVLKTEANNNNHIGVPLTILSAKSKHQVLVLEHGTNHFDEIKYSAEIAEPDISLITNIGDSHLEFLVDRKGVYKEKSALFEKTVDNRGILLINNDDAFLRKYNKDYKKRVTYGFKSESDIEGKIAGYTDDGRTKIEIKKGSTKIETVLPVYGKTSAINYLAAVSVAIKLGMTKSEILSATKKIKPVYKRLNVLSTKKMMMIDDTYNSNPDSMKAAMDLLKHIKKFDRKMVFAGDMFELGKDAKELHLSLVKDIVSAKINLFASIGKNMKYLSDKLKNTKVESRHFKSRDELFHFIDKNDFDNSVTLFKGSRGMKMEEFADYLRERVN